MITAVSFATLDGASQVEQDKSAVSGLAAKESRNIINRTSMCLMCKAGRRCTGLTHSYTEASLIMVQLALSGGSEQDSTAAKPISEAS